jgi:hypothetical protein
MAEKRVRPFAVMPDLIRHPLARLLRTHAAIEAHGSRIKSGMTAAYCGVRWLLPAFFRRLPSFGEYRSLDRGDGAFLFPIQ